MVVDFHKQITNIMNSRLIILYICQIFPLDRWYFFSFVNDPFIRSLPICWIILYCHYQGVFPQHYSSIPFPFHIEGQWIFPYDKKSQITGQPWKPISHQQRSYTFTRLHIISISLSSISCTWVGLLALFGILHCATCFPMVICPATSFIFFESFLFPQHFKSSVC